MPELRWILIVFGSALLIGIYLWGRRGAKDDAGEDAMLRIRPEADFEPRETVEPSVDVPEAEPSDSMDDVVAQDEPIEDDPSAAPTRAHTPDKESKWRERRDAQERPPDKESKWRERRDAQERPLVRAAQLDESREPTIEVMRPREARSPRIEPTFGDDSQTAELPVNEDVTIRAERETVPAAAMTSAASAPADAPTLGMSSTPPPRRIERRKIIALRLAAGPQRLSGAQLQGVFDGESLQHGKYDVFHRLDDQGATIFSVASMVEPGTFNLEKMPSEHYPGITLFTQLPGPVAGMLAFNELVACSRRLHAALGGTLQDERGVPLTVHRIERIRQEIREFEHRREGEGSQRASPTYTS